MCSSSSRMMHLISCLFHVWTLPEVSDKPQTMSGLSSVPNGTASQTILNRANRNSLASAIENRADANSDRLRAVMFCSLVPIRDTQSPKIVFWLADTLRGVLQTWTNHRRCSHRLVRNATFFEQNISCAFYLKSKSVIFL